MSGMPSHAPRATLTGLARAGSAPCRIPYQTRGIPHEPFGGSGARLPEGPDHPSKETHRLIQGVPELRNDASRGVCSPGHNRHVSASHQPFHQADANSRQPASGGPVHEAEGGEPRTAFNRSSRGWYDQRPRRGAAMRHDRAVLHHHIAARPRVRTDGIEVLPVQDAWIGQRGTGSRIERLPEQRRDVR